LQRERQPGFLIYPTHFRRKEAKNPMLLLTAFGMNRTVIQIARQKNRCRPLSRRLEFRREGNALSMPGYVCGLEKCSSWPQKRGTEIEEEHLMRSRANDDRFHAGIFDVSSRWV
jgi:hypothetical protein